MNSTNLGELTTSQLPTVYLLQDSSYTYLIPYEVLAQRGGRLRNVLLEGVLTDWLRTKNLLNSPVDTRKNPVASGLETGYNMRISPPIIRDGVRGGLVPPLRLNTGGLYENHSIRRWL